MPEAFVEIVQGLLARDPEKRLDARTAVAEMKSRFGEDLENSVIMVGV